MARASSNKMSMILNMALIVSFFFIIAMVEGRAVVDTYMKEPGCAAVVGVKSGDTCIGIATSYKLGIKYFDSINPNLNCEDLFVGQWLCIDN